MNVAEIYKNICSDKENVSLEQFKACLEELGIHAETTQDFFKLLLEYNIQTNKPLGIQ